MIFQGTAKMTGRAINLTGQRFGKLVALYPLPERHNGRTVWHCQCDCGNTADVVVTYLTRGEVTSCGCAHHVKDHINLRQKYDAKRVDGVVKPLFKDKMPRKDSSTGYRGVSKYYTRLSHELRYRSWITVKGKRHYKSGFLTPEDAYYQGRLMLEKEHLPFDKK